MQAALTQPRFGKTSAAHNGDTMVPKPCWVSPGQPDGSCGTEGGSLIGVAVCWTSNLPCCQLCSVLPPGKLLQCFVAEGNIEKYTMSQLSPLL